MSRSDGAEKLGGAPLDDIAFPDQLTLRVTTCDGEHLRGIHLDDDLAQHYGFADLLTLALGDRLGDAAQSAAAEVALCFAAKNAGGNAAVQAGIAARLGGSTPAALVGIVSLALAEQASAELVTMASLLTWLGEGSKGDPPKEHCKEDSAALHRALRKKGADDFAPDPRLSRRAATVSLLFRLGLQRKEELVAAFTAARSPAATAEVFAVRGRSFADYPANTPAFAYRSQQGAKSDG